MKTVKIEYICPELCHFYGDHANLFYLAKKAEHMGNRVEIIKTERGCKPAFTQGIIDMVYIGPTTDTYQTALVKTLLEYKYELKEYIENDGFVLATGNALEVFYESITDTDQNEIKALGFFPFQCQRFEGRRYSVNVIGEYNGRKIAGYKNLASKTTTVHNPYPLFNVIKEKGKLTEGAWEGIKYRNFYGTYLLGPILLQNPYFSNELLRQLFKDDYQEVYIPFEIAAYEKRVSDVMNDKNPDSNG